MVVDQVVYLLVVFVLVVFDWAEYFRVASIQVGFLQVMLLLAYFLSWECIKVFGE